MDISDTARLAMFNHAYNMAVKTPPQESVGILADGQYVPCENISRYPEISFRLDHHILAKHYPVEAIIHSHPAGEACPSKHDMQQQKVSNIPWIIVVVGTASQPDVTEEWFSWGHEPQLNMMAGYRHGVTDCYGLIRGWFHHEYRIILPDYPREWDWWHKKDNLYLDHFSEAGLIALPERHALKRGDVFLATIRSSIPNHAGIYIGDGLILHHLAGSSPVDTSRLPRKEPIERWKRFITTWLRHPKIG